MNKPLLNRKSQAAFKKGLRTLTPGSKNLLKGIGRGFTGVYAPVLKKKSSK